MGTTLISKMAMILPPKQVFKKISSIQ